MAELPLLLVREVGQARAPRAARTGNSVEYRLTKRPSVTGPASQVASEKDPAAADARRVPGVADARSDRRRPCASRLPPRRSRRRRLRPWPRGGSRSPAHTERRVRKTGLRVLGRILLRSRKGLHVVAHPIGHVVVQGLDPHPRIRLLADDVPRHGGDAASSPAGRASHRRMDRRGQRPHGSAVGEALQGWSGCVRCLGCRGLAPARRSPCCRRWLAPPSRDRDGRAAESAIGIDTGTGSGSRSGRFVRAGTPRWGCGAWPGTATPDRPRCAAAARAPRGPPCPSGFRGTSPRAWPGPRTRSWASARAGSPTMRRLTASVRSTMRSHTVKNRGRRLGVRARFMAARASQARGRTGKASTPSRWASHTGPFQVQGQRGREPHPAPVTRSTRTSHKPSRRTRRIRQSMSAKARIVDPPPPRRAAGRRTRRSSARRFQRALAWNCQSGAPLRRVHGRESAAVLAERRGRSRWRGRRPRTGPAPTCGTSQAIAPVSDVDRAQDLLARHRRRGPSSCRRSRTCRPPTPPAPACTACTSRASARSRGRWPGSKAVENQFVAPSTAGQTRAALGAPALVGNEHRDARPSRSRAPRSASSRTAWPGAARRSCGRARRRSRCGWRAAGAAAGSPASRRPRAPEAAGRPSPRRRAACTGSATSGGPSSGRGRGSNPSRGCRPRAASPS